MDFYTVVYTLMRDRLEGDEIESILFRLGIDPDDLPGQTRPARIQALLRRCRHRQMAAALVTALRHERPDVPWPEPPLPHTAPPPPPSDQHQPGAAGTLLALLGTGGILLATAVVAGLGVGLLLLRWDHLSVLFAPARTPVAGRVQTTTPTPPGPEPTPTASPRRSPTVPPRPTPEPALTWRLVAADPFDENRLGWSLGSYEDDSLTGARRLVGGELHWEATARKGFVWRAHPDLPELDDLYAAVAVRNVAGTRVRPYLIVRFVDRDTYYAFGLCYDSARFFFSLRFQGTWHTLIDCTAHADIRQDVNTLAVVAEGETFRLFINGHPVAQARDDRIRKGTAGLALGLDEAGSRAHLAFDDFELREKR